MDGRRRRDTLNRTFANNVVRSTIGRQNVSSRISGPMSMWNDRPEDMTPRIPHYEDDPDFVPRQEFEQHHRNVDDLRQLISPRVVPNHRGQWGGHLRGTGTRRGSDVSDREQQCTRAEPPMLLSGIPHLEKSFVMMAGEQEHHNQERPMVVERGRGSRARFASRGTRGRGSLLAARGRGTSRVAKRRMAVIQNLPSANVPLPSESELGIVQVQSSDKNANGLELNAICESENRANCEKHSVENVSLDSLESVKVKIEDINPLTTADNVTLDKIVTDSISSSVNISDISQEFVPADILPDLSADPAQLELETRKYYNELGSQNEPQQEVSQESLQSRESEIPAPVISAEQVAAIVSSVTDAVAAQDKAELKAEAALRAREEEFQTAWSVLHQYWSFVRDNPYDFNGWTYLLNHVEAMDNLDAARTAFEGFLPLYPYCFAYWKKLSDMELRHNDMKRSLGVLLLGTKCVPFCTDLWIPLLNNFIKYVKDEELPKEMVRELYEEGLKVVGNSWHSSTLWEAVLNYENHHGDLLTVMTLYERVLTVPTKLYNKHWDLFVAMVREHHPRNLLSVDEYQKLRRQCCEELKIKYTTTPLVRPRFVQKTPQPEDKLNSSIKEKIVAAYIKTHEATEEEVNKRWKFEEKIKRPYFHIKALDKKQLKNWNEYLDFEISLGDAVRIVSLFERCLVACAAYEEIWCRYATYMEGYVSRKINVRVEVTGTTGEGDEVGEEVTQPVLGENVGENEELGMVSVSEGCVPVGFETVKGNRETETGDNEKNEMSANEVKESSATDMNVTDEAVAAASGNNHGVTDSAKSNEVIPPPVDNDINDNNTKDNISSDKTDIPTKVVTMDSVMDECMDSLGLSKRVLMCPPLSVEWISDGVTWEDVRHVYRRAAWIHCPNKAAVLLQWAEFEELQGNLSIACELLHTVIAKHPTLLKARMQLIELERRQDNLKQVEELYSEAFQVLTQPRARSWLAIKYARFVFKIQLEADRALLILRKALKKDRGNVHLYHHVFDICYTRQPLDCRGVMASLALGLSSKELLDEDKFWFALKKTEFLREHGSMSDLRKAEEELCKWRDLAQIEEKNEAKRKAREKEKMEEANEAIDATIVTETAATEVQTGSQPAGGSTIEATQAHQYPIPYFSADGTITYTPMEGYGYGNADPSVPLPSASEVVGGIVVEKPAPQEYHSVPPSWELTLPTKSAYGYAKTEDNRWHQESGFLRYNDMISQGLRPELKDKKMEEFILPFPINIDHLKERPSEMNQMNQSNRMNPPGESSMFFQPQFPGRFPHDAKRQLPHECQYYGGPPMKRQFSDGRESLMGMDSMERRNIGMGEWGTGMGRMGSGIDGMAGSRAGMDRMGMGGNMDRLGGSMDRMGMDGIGGSRTGMDRIGMDRQGMSIGDRSGMVLDGRGILGDGNELFGERRALFGDGRRLLGDGRSLFMGGVSAPGRLQELRSEFNDNYTDLPGPSAPLMHQASFGNGPDGNFPHVNERLFTPEGNSGQANERLFAPDMESGNRNWPSSDSQRFGPSVRDLHDQAALRSSLDSLSPCMNVPDWLVREGGELRLSETQNGVSVIRYWPSYMTDAGQVNMFRVLRKSLKWHQCRMTLQQKSFPLPYLLSWLGPCNYSWVGVQLEQNTIWPPELVDLLHRMMKYTQTEFNSCLLSLYRTGHDSSEWLSENHPALGLQSHIGMVFIGTMRLLELRRKDGRGLLRFPLFPGSLLMMEGALQYDWEHRIVKQVSVATEAMCLSFRKMYMIEGVTVNSRM